LNNIIEATISNGNFKEDVLLLRIPMIWTDLPYDFKRLQFPARLTYAMIINNAQDNRYKFMDFIWKIYASHMDSSM